MSREDLIRKLSSRKLWLSAAAFLATFFTGVAGVLPPEWCTVGMALSAGIYVAGEAYVDGKSAGASQTISTTSVSASATSQKVVESALAPDAREA